MLIKAKLSYLRIAPRKARLVTDLIRGQKTIKALEQLQFLNKKATLPLIKLLQSAIANAKNDFQVEESDLFISKITVDEGPKLKRWRAVSRGRTAPIQKKTSHITLVLSIIEERKIKKVTKIKKKEEKENIKITRIKKPKLKIEKEIIKPKSETKVKRVFRRKAF